MKRDYSVLMAELSEEYQNHAPLSAELNRKARRYLVDGGSHAIRLMNPFPPRITKARGAWVEDEDGNRILDFWQGHYANILGHNSEVVTEPLANALERGQGLQGGFTDRYQAQVAEILCQQTGYDRVRFTTSGTLATMYAILLARGYTGRELVMKVGAGWHGAHPWGLKGTRWYKGFEAVESEGIPQTVTDQIVVTEFNNPELLEDHFRQHGDKLACFIVEPVIGGGGLMPATKEYLLAARTLADKYGVVLIYDEVISGFRFRAGDVGQIYGVKADLIALGKIIGGGMPVAAVAGRADIMNLVGRLEQNRVKFSGGTYAAHVGSMLAAKNCMTYLVDNEAEIYSTLAEMGEETRRTVTDAFAIEGILVRFAGDRSKILPQSSLHMLLFPYEEGLALISPEEVRNPETCDLDLTEKVVQLAMLLEDVHVVHGLGSTTTAHTDKEIQFLSEACQRVARRIKPYL